MLLFFLLGVDAYLDQQQYDALNLSRDLGGGVRVLFELSSNKEGQLTVCLQRGPEIAEIKVYNNEPASVRVLGAVQQHIKLQGDSIEDLTRELLFGLALLLAGFKAQKDEIIKTIAEFALVPFRDRIPGELRSELLNIQASNIDGFTKSMNIKLAFLRFGLYPKDWLEDKSRMLCPVPTLERYNLYLTPSQRLHTILEPGPDSYQRALDYVSPPNSSRFSPRSIQ